MKTGGKSYVESRGSDRSDTQRGSIGKLEISNRDIGFMKIGQNVKIRGIVTHLPSTAS